MTRQKKEETIMEIAIYSRKSRFTGTGDSVENQVQMCKDHLNYIYRDKVFNVTVYEDEGYTGKNTNRPMFKQLLQDIKQQKVNVVICYRLDRLSRSVADFSQLLGLLSQFNVEFISVSENFDTSTPMGRAMINIASVFAQLERETIAERVRDNKIVIAKGGRWQGGTPPTGYKAVTSTEMDGGNKTRKYFYLMEDIESDGYATVKLIFDLYLQNKSLNSIESYLMENKIHSSDGNEYSSSVIKQILINPVYATNHPAVFDYLSKNECIVLNARSEFDGTKGMIGYGKTVTTVKRKRTELTNWIVAFGKHKGIVDGEKWVQVQCILQDNSIKYPRLQTSKVALFSGMIRCSCGAPMLVQGNRPDKNGNPSYYYKCYRKSRSHGELCSVSNIHGVNFDSEIMDYISKAVKDGGTIEKDMSLFIKKTAQTKKEAQARIKQLQSEIVKKEASIEQLVLRLVDTNLSNKILTYVNDTIISISAEIDDFKSEVYNCNQQIVTANTDKMNLALVNQKMGEFAKLPADATVEEKRQLLKSIISRITWDGTNFAIALYTDVSG